MGEFTSSSAGVFENLGGTFAAAAVAYNLYEISQLPPAQQLPAANQAIWSLNGALYGAEFGAEAGSILGPVGSLIGGLAGGIAGGYFGNSFGAWLNGKHGGNGLK